jgi:hypothetical protein
MSNQEIIRRRQYCQIVKEITGSDQYLVVGPIVSRLSQSIRQLSRLFLGIVGQTTDSKNVRERV